MLPRLPRQVSLRFAGDETPIYRSNALLLRNRQYRVKRAAHRAGHKFRADHGAVVSLQPGHFAAEVFRPAVVVKRNNVRLTQLNLLQFTEVRPIWRWYRPPTPRW